MKHLKNILPVIILVCCVSFSIAQTSVRQLDLKPEGETIALQVPLYISCAHHFQLNGIFSANEYDYHLKIKNGTVVPGRKPGAFAVYPGIEKNGAVEIYYKNKIWNTIAFKVETSPAPTLVLQTNNEIMDLTKPVPSAELSIVAQPNRKFKRKYPKDATYRIRRVTVSQLRNEQLVRQKKVYDSTFELKKQGFRVQSGDKIVIEANPVLHITSRGQILKLVPKNTKLTFILK